MENTPQYVAAIDVGTTKIATLLGKRTETGKVEVVDFTCSNSKGIRRGEVLNPEEASVVVKETVASLQNSTGIRFSEVFVGVAGQHINIRKSRSFINRQDADESISVDDVGKLKADMSNIPLEEGKKIIHILPRDYVVDGEPNIANPVGMIGKRLEGNFNIVVGSSDSLKRVEKCIRQAGLTIREIILEPLASSDAVLYDEEREAGVALVDIGGGTTDIAVFCDNVLVHSAVIPFGGNVITKDVKDACGLSEQVAEEVKVQFGMALANEADENKVIVIPAKIPGREAKEISFRNLANIIQARMEEIIDAILFHIENSGCADKLGSGIVITGGGSMLAHLKQLFHYRTGREVRIGLPGEHLAGDTENINEPRFATGVGLLMKGFAHIDEHQWSMHTEPVRQQPVENVEPENRNPETPATSAYPGKGFFERIRKELIGYFEDEPKSSM
ncbi:MAG: cell division protein FtsA [Bacteroidales bacterium]|jgi:cell division protein FtsA|nr:cell division protein FtsA [Bacteroidales bacterium]